jgi:hypothetical protein
MTGWRKRQIEDAKMQDDEFNRIEREAVARKMSVAYNLEMQRLRDEFPFGIPFVTQEELERLRMEHGHD